MESIHLKSPAEIEKLRESGHLVARIHKSISEVVRPGLTTGELDRRVETMIRAAGARPAFKGYARENKGKFPASICASVNEEVVHGIPGKRVLRDGDIISVDLGVELNGYFGDMAVTHTVGEVDGRLRKLLEVTEEAVFVGIRMARPGNRISDIARAIQTMVEENNFSVVREYVGHGIGRIMHEPPQVPNFWDDSMTGQDRRLEPGMVMALEPMVNMGTWKTRELADRWTVVTRDRKPSAHFEHMVAVREDGPDILTLLDDKRSEGGRG